MDRRSLRTFASQVDEREPTKELRSRGSENQIRTVARGLGKVVSPVQCCYDKQEEILEVTI